MKLPVAKEDPSRLLAAAGLLNLVRRVVVGGAGRWGVVGRLVGKRMKAGDGDEGKVLLGRGGNVTRKASNGVSVVDDGDSFTLTASEDGRSSPGVSTGSDFCPSGP